MKLQKLKNSGYTRSASTHASHLSRALLHADSRACLATAQQKAKIILLFFVRCVISLCETLKNSLPSLYFASCTKSAVFFSKWCTIFDKMAALFVPHGDLVDFDVVGALLSTATSPSLPVVENRFSRSW